LFGEIEQSRKQPFRFMSVRPSVHMHHLGSLWTHFVEIWHWGRVRKSAETIQIWLKSDKTSGTLHEDRTRFILFFWSNYHQQDAKFLDLLISTEALHVSGGSSAHHQEHIPVHTASGIVNQYYCWLLSWIG